MAKKQSDKKADADLTDDQVDTQGASADDAELTSEEVTEDAEPVGEEAEATVDSTVVTTEPAPEPLDLHRKIEKFLSGTRSSGNPDAVHALNKIEHLTGTLRYSLPAAIAAVEDGDLKSGLETLLKLL